MTSKMKKWVVSLLSAAVLLSICAIPASASYEKVYADGSVEIYMDTANRAWWSDHYVYAYDRRFDGANASNSGSTVRLLAQSNRPDTGWITQDSWEITKGGAFANYYTWAKSNSEWRVHLRTITDRYDSYALGVMHSA